MSPLEPVFTGGVRWMGEGFSRQSRRFDAGILCVFQGEATQSDGKRPVQTAYNAREYRFLYYESGDSAAYLQQLLLELALNAPEFRLGLAAFLRAVGLNLQHLVKGGDQALIGVLQRFDIHHAPL